MNAKRTKWSKRDYCQRKRKRKCKGRKSSNRKERKSLKNSTRKTGCGNKKMIWNVEKGKFREKYRKIKEWKKNFIKTEWIDKDNLGNK